MRKREPLENLYLVMLDVKNTLAPWQLVINALP